MSDECKPLWSDERIIRRISIHPQIYAAIIKMRDEYEAALAAAHDQVLKAEYYLNEALKNVADMASMYNAAQAQEWEPVPDGDYGLIGIQHDGERLCLYIDEPCRLPEGWRLMRPRAEGEKMTPGRKHFTGVLQVVSFPGMHYHEVPIANKVFDLQIIEGRWYATDEDSKQIPAYGFRGIWVEL